LTFFGVVAGSGHAGVVDWISILQLIGVIEWMSVGVESRCSGCGRIEEGVATNEVPRTDIINPAHARKTSTGLNNERLFNEFKPLQQQSSFGLLGEEIYDCLQYQGEHRVEDLMKLKEYTLAAHLKSNKFTHNQCTSFHSNRRG
jgi:hypothetical protein